MDCQLCYRTDCINWKNGRCSIKDPEKYQKACLHYDDTLDNLRLKADAIKGTLG